MKGTPNPIEYTNNNAAPFPALSEVLAYRSIEAKIGPTQGVHPNPKAIPKRKVPSKPRLPAGRFNLRSL